MFLPTVDSDTIHNQLPQWWTETTLGKVAIIKVWFVWKVSDSISTKEEGIAMITTKNIRNGQIDISDVYYVNEGFHYKNKKSALKRWDIVVARHWDDDNGKAAMMKLDIELNCMNVIVVRPEKEIIYWNYLLHFMSSKNYLSQVQWLAGWSVQKVINTRQLEEISISLPSLPEQKAIASLLSSFDDKIELLREQNKTLETLGQTIFQEWFGKYSVDEPESLPEGWRVGKITEIIKRKPVSYKCDKKDLDPNGRTPIIDQGSNGLYGYTSRDPDFIASKENPVIVFTNHTCNYRFIDYPFCAIQNILPYRGKDGYDEYFLYFMTKWSISFIEYKGHRPDFEAKDFIIPTIEKAKEFSKIAKPILQKISDNNSAIQSLSNSRDALLPKLMSGEVRVEF